jgi:hypothetical protein
MAAVRRLEEREEQALEELHQANSNISAMLKEVDYQAFPADFAKHFPRFQPEIPEFDGSVSPDTVKQLASNGEVSFHGVPRSASFITCSSLSGICC